MTDQIKGRVLGEERLRSRNARCAVRMIANAGFLFGGSEGYRVKLFFLQLPTPEMAIWRVAQRVREGGHDVPEAVIRRRFETGWRNFDQVYRGLVDGWILYDNSGDEPKRLAEESRV